MLEMDSLQAIRILGNLFQKGYYTYQSQDPGPGHNRIYSSNLYYICQPHLINGTPRELGDVRGLVQKSTLSILWTVSPGLTLATLVAWLTMHIKTSPAASAMRPSVPSPVPNVRYSARGIESAVVNSTIHFGMLRTCTFPDTSSLDW